MYYVVQIVFLKLVVQYVIKLLSSIFDFFVCFFMSTWQRTSSSLWDFSLCGNASLYSLTYLYHR